jgi:hypothetical protein
VLLTLLFGLAAAAHIAALPVTALLGLVLMLWVAEGHRSQALPVVLAASAGALVLLFLCYGCSPDAFSYVFRSAAGFLWLSLDPARRFFSSFAHAGISVAAGAALVLYLALGRSRYFGNTTPLFCALVCFLLVMTGAPGSPWLWALPFLFTFIGGVFADAYESPRGRMAVAAGATLALLQAALCVASLPSLFDRFLPPGAHPKPSALAALRRELSSPVATPVSGPVSRPVSGSSADPAQPSLNDS